MQSATRLVEAADLRERYIEGQLRGKHEDNRKIAFSTNEADCESSTVANDEHFPIEARYILLAE